MPERVNLKQLAILLALIVFCIPGTLGAIVVSDTVTTGAGSVSYRIYNSGGTVTQAPITEDCGGE